MTRTLRISISLLVLAAGLGLGAPLAQAAGTKTNTGVGISRPGRMSPMLTSQECKKLGGSFTLDAAECTKAGQWTCTTITATANGGTQENHSCVDEVTR